MSEPIKNIIVDGKEYPIEQFSPQVKNLLDIRQSWTDDLAVERAKVIKTEAAIRQLDGELTALVQKELAPVAANDAAPADAAPAAETPDAAPAA